MLTEILTAFVLFIHKDASLTLSQTSLGFYVSAGTSRLKTPWEKEKLLVTKFYPFRELSAVFIKFEIVVLKSQEYVVWEMVNAEYSLKIRHNTCKKETYSYLSAARLDRTSTCISEYQTTPQT